MTPTDLSSTGDLCTNNTLTFSYPDLGSLPDEASLLWDFDGESTSNEDSPTYTFSSTGTKTIGLQVVLGSCTTAVYNEDIVLNEGPSVGFSYTNNCWDGMEAEIQFTDASSTDGTSYDWDFGDGVGTASSPTSINPTYAYTATGTYTVSLTVTASNLCTSTYTEDIVVSDASLASLSVSSTYERGISGDFDGIDATGSDDTVISWLWDFGDGGSSNDQNAMHTYTVEGNYLVSLTVGTSQGCSETLTTSVEVVLPDYPVATFLSSAEELCLSEGLTLTNTSVNGSQYSWDFCVGDILGDPTTGNYTISGLGDGFGYDLVEQGGNFYGFVVDKTNNKLYRLDYGSDPVNASPTVTDLGNPGSLLVNLSPSPYWSREGTGTVL